MKTFVKICGLTNIEDALIAVDAGADLLGFILYPKSSRFVEPSDIAKIVHAVRATPRYKKLDRNSTGSIHTVGVFVDEDEQTISQILQETKLDLAQLHGDESPDLLRAFGDRSYKALRPSNADAAKAEAARYALPVTESSTGAPDDLPRWLLDAYEPDMYGGTGKRADWQSAAQLARQYPGLLLAGGLTSENVASAIDVVRPWGVDVASGVEQSPGKKDHKAVRDFIRAAQKSNL